MTSGSKGGGTRGRKFYSGAWQHKARGEGGGEYGKGVRDFSCAVFRFWSSIFRFGQLRTHRCTLRIVPRVKLL